MTGLPACAYTLTLFTAGFLFRMESRTHVFQISGIKAQDKKRVLIKGIYQLGGKYIGGSVSGHSQTYVVFLIQQFTIFFLP